jgi:hypothetical protein
VTAGALFVSEFGTVAAAVQAAEQTAPEPDLPVDFFSRQGRSARVLTCPVAMLKALAALASGGAFPSAESGSSTFCLWKRLGRAPTRPRTESRRFLSVNETQHMLPRKFGQRGKRSTSCDTADLSPDLFPQPYVNLIYPPAFPFVSVISVISLGAHPVPPLSEKEFARRICLILQNQV